MAEIEESSVPSLAYKVVYIDYYSEFSWSINGLIWESRGDAESSATHMGTSPGDCSEHFQRDMRSYSDSGAITVLRGI